MGELYQAQQRSTRRVRALKVMHEHIAADLALRARFAREATVVASVSSAHIVEVLAAGMEEDGLAWIAMEWLDGVDLATHLRDRRALSPAAVSALVAQLGHALGVAHSAGIVHRDLKPENIFLARTQRADGAVTLKLLDFGIARVVAEATVSRGTSTLGSPLWMAPEQYDPDRPITAAADVWSLGLVVFRALTGRHYLRAAHAQRGPTPEAVMSEVLLANLPLASARAREIGVEGPLPEGFDGWFSRCVARDPDERFEDGGVAARALVALLGSGDASELVPATPPSASAAEPATHPEQNARDAPTVAARADGGSATLDAATRDHTAIEELSSRGPDDRSPSATDTADRGRTSTLGSSTAASVLSVNKTSEAPRSNRTRVALAVSGAIGVVASVVFASVLVSRPTPVQLTGQRPWYAPWAAQVRARVQPLEPRLRACVSGPSRGPMRVLASYRADGSFVRAYIGGAFSGTDEARCVEALLRSVEAPATGGGDATVPFSFDLWGPAVGTPLATSSGDASASTALDASAEDAMTTVRSRVMIIAGAATLAAASANAQASGPATSAPSAAISAQVDRLFVLPAGDIRSFSVGHAGALEVRLHPNGRWLLVVPRLQGSYTLTLVRRDGVTDALSVNAVTGSPAPAIPTEGVPLSGRALRATHVIGACRVLSATTGPQLRPLGAGSCHVVFDNGTQAPLVEDYTVGAARAVSAPPTVAPTAQARVRFSQRNGLRMALEATAPGLHVLARVSAVRSPRPTCTESSSRPSPVIAESSSRGSGSTSPASPLRTTKKQKKTRSER
jgi:serine/threonine protein kinase